MTGSSKHEFMANFEKVTLCSNYKFERLHPAGWLYNGNPSRLCWELCLCAGQPVSYASVMNHHAATVAAVMACCAYLSAMAQEANLHAASLPGRMPAVKVAGMERGCCSPCLGSLLDGSRPLQHRVPTHSPHHGALAPAPKLGAMAVRPRRVLALALLAACMISGVRSQSWNFAGVTDKEQAATAAVTDPVLRTLARKSMSPVRYATAPHAAAWAAPMLRDA